MKNKLYILLILFCGIISSKGQSKLTISEAVKNTLENNLEIKYYENLEKISKNNSSILNNNYLPNVQLGTDLNTNIQNIEIETPDGLSGQLDNSKIDNNNSTISLNYNIIDASGRRFNYKKSKELYSKSKLEVKEIIENTLMQLFSIFFEVGRLTEEKNILQNTLQISKERYKRKLVQFEYGQTNKLEILNAEVDVNSDSINLLNTSKELSNVKRDLNLIMNVNLDNNFEIENSINFTEKAILIDAYSKGIIGNTKFLISEKDIIISNLEDKATRFSYLPTIGLIGSYGWNESINDNPYAFYKKSFSNGFTAGLSVRWNLFSGGKRITANKNSKIYYENTEITKEKIKLELESEFKNAYQTHLNNIYILEAQEKNLEVNKDNFERNKEKYKIGSISSIEFRNAQLNLLNAQLRENIFRYQAKISELYFLKLSGQIISRFK